MKVYKVFFDERGSHNEYPAHMLAEAQAFAQSINSSVTEVTLPDPDTKEEENLALAAAWKFIDQWFDSPAFIQLSDWKHALTSDHAVQPLILAVEAWKNAIMFEYLMVKKPAIQARQNYDLDYSFVGEPPCKFTDCFLAVNPQYQPQGYTLPNVANYTPGTR